MGTGSANCGALRRRCPHGTTPRSPAPTRPLHPDRRRQALGDGYNRRVRFVAVLSLLLATTACNRGTQNKDAVRQGLMEYLSNRPNLSMGGMTVDVTRVTFNGNQAEAVVSFTPKGGPAGNGMSMRYTLEQKNGKWVVAGRADSGQNPHGSAAMPGAANPHGGGMPGMPPAGGIDTERPGGAPSGALPPGHPSVGAPPSDSGKK